MKLLSTTILAAGVIAVAGAAYADNSGRKEIEITPAHKLDPYKPDVPYIDPHFSFHPLHTSKSHDIRNVQVNVGDMTAKTDVDIYDRHGNLDLTSTTAAIGNSFTLEAIEAYDAYYGDVISYQFSDGDMLAVGNLYSKLDDIDDLSMTVAAIGNSLSIEMDEVKPASHETKFDVWNEQVVEGGQWYKKRTRYGWRWAYKPTTIEAYGNVYAEEIDYADVTVAAIGNSASIDLDDIEYFYETRVGNVQDNGASWVTADLDYFVERAKELDATTAAIGNSLSLVLEDIGGKGASVMNSQVNKSWWTVAETDIKVGDVENLTSTTAAIGNTASIEVENPTDLRDVTSAQYNRSYMGAFADIRAYGDAHDGEDLEATVAAIGNSFSLEVEYVDNGYNYGGDLVLSQVNKTRYVDSVLELYASNLDVTATAAAIGNSLSLELSDKKGMDLAIFQMNKADVYAYGDIDLRNAGTVETTVAAIGNSISVDVNGDHNGRNAFGDVELMQVNLGDGFAKQKLDLTGSTRDVTATTAAIGNSASLTLSGDFFDGVKSAQVNHGDMVAKTYVDMSHGAASGHTNVDVTSAAIGNSLSITIK